MIESRISRPLGDVVSSESRSCWLRGAFSHEIDNRKSTAHASQLQRSQAGVDVLSLSLVYMK